MEIGTTENYIKKPRQFQRLGFSLSSIGCFLRDKRLRTPSLKKYTIFEQMQWGKAIWRLASFYNAASRLNLPERGIQTPIGTASKKAGFK